MYGTGNDLQNYPCLCLVIAIINTIPNNLKELSPVLMTVSAETESYDGFVFLRYICLPVAKEIF